MTHGQMVKCFNEWMRRFVEEPEAFAGEYESVHQYLKEQADGKEPTYGDVCASYLEKIEQEIGA